MPHQSVSEWIALLKEGDADAVRYLWERFSHQLIDLARKRISNLSQRAADEDDIAQSVFMSLCRGAAAGRFSKVENRDELWWLLVALTKQKAVDLTRKEMARKRGAGRVKTESSFDIGFAEQGHFSLDQLIGQQPTPEFVTVMDDEHTRLLGLLRNDQLRTIATLRIEGYTVDEVAAQLSITSRSVERKLNLIRAAWATELKRA